MGFFDFLKQANINQGIEEYKKTVLLLYIIEYLGVSIVFRSFFILSTPEVFLAFAFVRRFREYIRCARDLPDSIKPLYQTRLLLHPGTASATLPDVLSASHSYYTEPVPL